MPALNITIVNATDLRETEFLGNKQDPYVIIRSDCEECKTVTHMDGGKNPGPSATGVWSLVWNETKIINYTNPNVNIEFTMYVLREVVTCSMNENKLKDTLIGTASFSITQMMSTGFAGWRKGTVWFLDINLPVSSKGRQCGYLRVVVTSGGSELLLFL